MGLLATGAGLIAATYGLVRLAYGLFLPDVQLALGFSEATAGLISSGASVMYCVGATVGFFLASRQPRSLIVAAALSASLGSGGNGSVVPDRCLCHLRHGEFGRRRPCVAGAGHHRPAECAGYEEQPQPGNREFRHRSRTRRRWHSRACPPAELAIGLVPCCRRHTRDCRGRPGTGPWPAEGWSRGRADRPTHSAPFMVRSAPACDPGGGLAGHRFGGCLELRENTSRRRRRQRPGLDHGVVCLGAWRNSSHRYRTVDERPPPPHGLEHHHCLGRRSVSRARAGTECHRRCPGGVRSFRLGLHRRNRRAHCLDDKYRCRSRTGRNVPTLRHSCSWSGAGCRGRRAAHFIRGLCYRISRRLGSGNTGDGGTLIDEKEFG